MLLTNLVNIVPLDPLLPYSSRRVTVTFAYADNRGEHANRAKSRQRSVQGLRPEGAKGLSPGFNRGTRHAKMRPESGARMISIRYGAPDNGAPSGHIA